MLGLDSTYFRIYDESFARLMTNWKLLGWVSILGGVAYALRPADSEGDQLQAQCPGYLIMFFTLCVQSVNVLFINLELAQCARIVYGVMMGFGAITVAVGYLLNLNDDGNESTTAKCRLVAIALFVVCITGYWAFDFVMEMPKVPGKGNKEIEENMNAQSVEQHTEQSEANSQMNGREDRL